jgi:hypothetical protein
MYKTILQKGDTLTKDNLILFPYKPSHKIVPPSTIEEVRELSTNIRYNQVEEVMSTVFPMLIENFSMCGINVSEESVKEHVLLHETIRATLLSYYGLYHPVQELAEKFVKEDESGDMIIDVSKLHRKRKKLEPQQ